MQRNRRLLLLGIVGVMLVIGGALVFAQGGNGVGDCDDPLVGLNVRFSVRYWDQTDFCQTNIDLETVLSGGPPPDGIPPIDNPVFESVADASTWLVSQSPVVVVTIGEDTRAYPLAILTWHEIVNTEQDGTPITVTFCPLCNSAIVFDRNVDGEVLDFGVSGNLRNSDMIMYDRQTQSWWQQFTGEGIVGVYTNTQLTLLPSQVVGFGEFATSFPDGMVLSRQTGTSRNYGRNPYAGYDSTTGRPFLFDGELDDRLPATERVLGGIIGGEAKAYPFPVLRSERVINDSIGGRAVLAVWQPGVVSALDASVIDESQDIGTAAIYSRELADGTVLTFTFTSDGTLLDEQTGSQWNVFGLAESGELEGTQLRLQVGGAHFWFAWNAFHPEAELYGMG
jgi:hypothetical protein